jgi:hypothetical protein
VRSGSAGVLVRLALVRLALATIGALQPIAAAADILRVRDHLPAGVALGCPVGVSTPPVTGQRSTGRARAELASDVVIG